MKASRSSRRVLVLAIPIAAWSAACASDVIPADAAVDSTPDVAADSERDIPNSCGSTLTRNNSVFCTPACNPATEFCQDNEGLASKACHSLPPTCLSMPRCDCLMVTVHCPIVPTALLTIDDHGLVTAHRPPDRVPLDFGLGVFDVSMNHSTSRAPMNGAERPARRAELAMLGRRTAMLVALSREESSWASSPNSQAY